MQYFNSLFGDKNDEEDKYYWDKFFEKIVLIVGVIILPLFFLVLFFAYADDFLKYCKIIYTFIYIVFMGMLIGVIVISLMTAIIIEVRQKMGIYAKNCVPACTSCLWIFVILPLIVGAPAAIVYFGTSAANYSTISNVVIGTAFVILMIGVSVAAIVLNVAFKAIHYEKKAKFVLKSIGEKLTAIAVKGPEELLRIIYDNYAMNGEEVLLKAIKEEEAINWWPIPIEGKDFQHNKILVDKDKFKTLKDLAEYDAKKKEEAETTKKNKAEERKKAKEKAAEEEKEREREREKQKLLESRFCCAICYEEDFEEKDNTEEDAKPIEAQVMRQDTRMPENSNFRALAERASKEQKEEVKKEEEVVERAADVNYQDFLDIISGRGINSNRLLEIIKIKPDCLKRFYDLIFQAFAKGSLKEYPLMWMTSDNFMDFCINSGILDYYSLEEEDLARETQDINVIYIKITSERIDLVIN